MKLLIVEDEPAVAARIGRLAGELLADLTPCIQNCDRIDDAIDLLHEQPVDLVLLDLELFGRSGFELLDGFAAAPSHTIIISAHADHALTAFEHGVLDFVAKPFSRERLQKALSRWRDVDSRAQRAPLQLCVKTRAGLERIALATIRYIRASGHYSELVLDSGDIRLHDKPIERLAQLLPAEFERIHRSTLVPRTRIRRLLVSPGGRYAVELDNGEELALARARYPQLRALFDAEDAGNAST